MDFCPSSYQISFIFHLLLSMNYSKPLSKGVNTNLVNAWKSKISRQYSILSIISPLQVSSFVFNSVHVFGAAIDPDDFCNLLLKEASLELQSLCYDWTTKGNKIS